MLEVYAGNEYPLLSRIILCFLSVNQCSCPSLAPRDSAVYEVNWQAAAQRQPRPTEGKPVGPRCHLACAFMHLIERMSILVWLKTFLKCACVWVTLVWDILEQSFHHSMDVTRCWGSFCCLVEENRSLMCSRRGLCGPVVVSWQITKPRKKKKKGKKKKSNPCLIKWHRSRKRQASAAYFCVHIKRRCD